MAKEFNMKIQAPFEQIQTTTFLPNPIFGNSVITAAEVARKKSMNGATYTYVKKKDRRKISLTVEITRDKLLELQEFVSIYLTADIRLTTHEDEVWKVVFANDPFEFEAIVSGSHFQVKLDFEGRKLNDPQFDC